MNALKLNMLRRGYFPKELPPCFVSGPLANWVVRVGSSLPKSSEKTALLATHSLARAGGVRRILSIPNPALFIGLCDEVETGWSELLAMIARSTLSHSVPTQGMLVGRAVEPEHALGDLSLVRVKTRRAARYTLIADVAEYYRSLYTHSIPWALHGKAVAKRERKKREHLGNRLDAALSSMQDGQTNGIPVGPDSSLVIGELILSAVDNRLNEQLGPLTGFRYYDDYELSFHRYSDAENALRALQASLAEYNLQLNPLKTRIVELPQSAEVPWVLEFRDFDFQRGRVNSRQRIVRFFDRAFEYRERHRDSHILSYVVGRVEREHWSSAEWSVVQDLLFQSVSVEPSAAQSFVTALFGAAVEGREVDLEGLGDVLNQIVEMNAESGNASETVWALWGMLAFELKVSEQAVKSLSKCSDVFAALLTLDARARGLLNGSLDLERWSAMLTKSELYRSHWLLAYEASVRGWLPTADSKDHVEGDLFFSQLKAAGILFYEPVGTPSELVMKQLETRKAKSYGDSDDEDDDDEDDDVFVDEDEPEDEADEDSIDEPDGDEGDDI